MNAHAHAHAPSDLGFSLAPPPCLMFPVFPVFPAPGKFSRINGEHTTFGCLPWKQGNSKTGRSCCREGMLRPSVRRDWGVRPPERGMFPGAETRGNGGNSLRGVPAAYGVWKVFICFSRTYAFSCSSPEQWNSTLRVYVRREFGRKPVCVETEGVAETLMALLGRLMFRVGQLDGWQVVPVLVGAGGTGKSMIVDAAASLLAGSSVGTLSNNHEQVFQPFLSGARGEAGLGGPPPVDPEQKLDQNPTKGLTLPRSLRGICRLHRCSGWNRWWTRSSSSVATCPRTWRRCSSR